MRKRDFFILSTNTAVTRTSVFASELAAVAAAQCNGHSSAGSHEVGTVPKHNVEGVKVSPNEMRDVNNLR